MMYTAQEVFDFVREEDVKFIRLAFCDMLGRQKNISILPSELRRAFEDGISFDASAICGFGSAEKSDLLLFPDPWPKKRHAPRRFVNPENLKEIARILRPGGLFRIATDHPIYKSWSLRQMHKDKNFRWAATCGKDWKTQPSDWVETKYQRKAIREGRRPIFLDFIRL